jgi:hypothetical protein
MMRDRQIPKRYTDSVAQSRPGGGSVSPVCCRMRGKVRLLTESNTWRSSITKLESALLYLAV